jgi:hypothetical protein
MHACTLGGPFVVEAFKARKEMVRARVIRALPDAVQMRYS